jgi:TetR/AcrR family transcriptional repressor of bet genes
MKAVAKRQIQEIRKEELIIATLRSIRKHGYVNSTINTIAEESGLSRGLINHYFDGKEDLLIFATKYYWKNVDDFFRHVVVSTEGNHFEKLLNAVYVTFLRDTGYDRMMVHYYSAACVMPSVLAMHRDMWGRYRTSIERRISAVAREKNMVLDTRLAAITLTQLVDGLWLGSVMEESYTREDCRRILRQWLCEQFSEDPNDHLLTPNFNLENYTTTAPLPKPE